MSNKCPFCGSGNLVLLVAFRDDLRGKYRCSACGCDFVYPPFTLFERIIASPEVLAPKFVYHVTSILDGMDKPKKIWYSTITQGKFFDTETEAKRATVAKLKETSDV